MLGDGGELALVDVREELIFSQSHLLLARSVPLSRFELKFAQLVPRRATRIVLCDDGDGLAERAAAILSRNGYSDVRILAGGVDCLGARPASSCSPASTCRAKRSANISSTPTARPVSQPANSKSCCATAPTWSCSTAGHSMNMRACRSRPPPTYPARSWFFARARSRRRRRRHWSSIAPAAPAALSARSR